MNGQERKIINNEIRLIMNIVICKIPYYRDCVIQGVKITGWGRRKSHHVASRTKHSNFSAAKRTQTFSHDVIKERLQPSAMRDGCVDGCLWFLFKESQSWLHNTSMELKALSVHALFGNIRQRGLNVYMLLLQHQ